MKQVFLVIDEARRQNAIQFIEDIAADGSKEIEIRDKKNSKTNKQNAALFAVAYPPLMEFMGMRGEKDRLDLHEYWCGEYWGWKTYKILNKKKSKPVRTTTRNEEGKRDLISTTEMTDFYQFIQQRGADHCVYIPDPDPTYGLNFI